MESRLFRLFLTGTYKTLFGLLVIISSNSQAADPLEKKTEQIILPELERREIKQATVDADDFEIGVFAGALSIEDFGVNPVYGAKLAYHITEDIFTEIAVGQSEASETSFEVLSGGLKLLTEDERDLTYYNISIGYNLFSGESFFGQKAFNSDLYLIAGVGNTNFANSDHFTWNVGAGYRFIPRDWFTLHVDVRDHIFNSDILGADKQTHNLEITAGFSLFF
jgi:outer membrane beta-barrel protein